MGELVGQRLGDFEVVRELGRGGMGVVYEARQLSLNRRVALKVLSPGLGLTPKAVERFRREAEAAAKLHHTNIVPVYATGAERGYHFYAMELIDGPSLDTVIRQLRGPRGDTPTSPTPASLPAELAATGPYVDATSLTPSGSGGSGLSSGGGYFDAAARMVADVADALHHAHQGQVIHRDIKPSNLLLSPEGRLSVSDFGLARVLEQPGMTVTGEFVGTPAYMSPEQITAGRIPTDHRTDVYSLGATLYELLTLRPPFVGERRDMILAQVVQKEPVAPRKVNPQVPRDLETVCLKCLEKDPDRRYANAKELADDLRRYVNRFAILAKRTGPLAKAAKWVKRNPALTAALVAAVLGVGAGGAFAWRAHRAQREHDARLLDERRRAALEKAIFLARVEDFDGARQAIREAEDLGCSEGQIQMLRGELEFSQGNMQGAIQYLRRAVELLPESVAARSLLAVALSQAGHVTEYHRVLGEVLRLTPITPEDHLFRGQAEAILDPDRGLKYLNEANRQRQSVLSQLIRLDLLRLHLLDKPNVENAKLVMSDAQSIRRMYPDNVTVQILSTTVHTTCSHVFGDLQQPDLRKVALDEGLKSAEALARVPHSAKALSVRWVFFDETGQSDRVVSELRASREGTRDVYLNYYYMVYLYKNGQFELANKVLEEFRGDNLQDLLRVIVLAECPDGYARATKLFREIEARGLTTWDLFNSQSVLRFLGRKQDAVVVSRSFLTRRDQFPPVRQESFEWTLKYCADQCSEQELLTALQGSLADLSNARFCIALTALAGGDRVKARQNFQHCIDTHFYEFLPYDLSKMFLSRMDKDPNWPHWIPHVAPMPREVRRP